MPRRPSNGECHPKGIKGPKLIVTHKKSADDMKQERKQTKSRKQSVRQMENGVQSDDHQSIRLVVVTGLSNSLLEKLGNSPDLKLEASKIKKIAEDLERAMIGKKISILILFLAAIVLYVTISVCLSIHVQ